ncbi:MAG TPA: tyrosine-type recombinase/integrase [Rectinemataceae bacterium]|nr:tyrosine-type recombinase/integrase [Rectinemataceae bacterium]
MPTGRHRAARPVVETFTVDAVIHAAKAESFTREDAARVLAVFKDRGFVTKVTMKDEPAAELALAFLRRAWTEDGPYVAERRAYGHVLTRRHIREMAAIVERYWAAPLAGLTLADLTRARIKVILVGLSESGLAAATVNKAFACLATPLGWAARNDLIPEDPSEGIPTFTAPARKKGILTGEELSSLVGLAWPDSRARAAFLVAATTGMRLGEIMALQGRDIGEDRLFIRHSWNDDDRLKCPKNGEEREAPLLPEVRAALLALLAENPHGTGADTFVIFGAQADRPLDGQAVSRYFNLALEAIGISDKARQGRGLSFHSLRHGYAKAMADRLDTARAMKATGHLSAAMLAHYADHRSAEDLAAVAGAQADAFGKVLSFRKGA